jgi:hypothetical protein
VLIARRVRGTGWEAQGACQTPRDVLVDMGLESKKVSRLGTGKATTSRQRAKSRLIEMGISQSIANRMLATKPSLSQADEDAAAAATVAMTGVDELSRLTTVNETAADEEEEGEERGEWGSRKGCG